MFPPSVYTSQDPVTGTCTFTLEFIYNFFVIFQYTTSPRDSNPLSLVVYHEFCAQASNILKYNFFVILKHTTKRHLNGYSELYKSSNVFQYSVTLLTTFNGWGRALSDCQRQALFLVATKVMVNATAQIESISHLVNHIETHL